jgi:hypothetical protein
MPGEYITIYSSQVRPGVICAEFPHYYIIIWIQLNGLILPRHVEYSAILTMPRTPRKKWSIYPSLHNNVSDLLREHDLFF